MIKTFSKTIPDELYINSFALEKQVTITYDGPSAIRVIVDKEFGSIFNVILNDEEEIHYNQDVFRVVEVIANENPDVAHYLSITDHQHVFEDEEQVDGSVYQRITNPSLKDMYSINYNFETNEWVWTLITRNPKSILNIIADKYRAVIEDNEAVLSNDEDLNDIVTAYLEELDEFETTGAGSIPSWKMIEPNTSLVPPLPYEVYTAVIGSL